MEDKGTLEAAEMRKDVVVAHCLKDLQKTLEQISTMEAAPVIGSEEYKADPKEWGVRTDKAEELLHKAVQIALATIPDEIRVIYDQIDDQHSRIWRIGKYREQKLS